MAERKPWTDTQRAAARRFLARVQPNNPAAELVQNLEDLMPAKWREGFEALFATLRDGSESK